MGSSTSPPWCPPVPAVNRAPPSPGGRPAIAHFTEEETEAGRGYTRLGALPLLPTGSFRERRGVVLELPWGTPGLDGMQPRDCGLDKDGRSEDRPQPLPPHPPQLFLFPLPRQPFSPTPPHPMSLWRGAVQRRGAPEEWGLATVTCLSGHCSRPPSVCGCLEWRRESQSPEEPGWSQMGARGLPTGDDTALMARTASGPVAGGSRTVFPRKGAGSVTDEHKTHWLSWGQGR